jgi:hypothetical protein
VSQSGNGGQQALAPSTGISSSVHSGGISDEQEKARRLVHTSGPASSAGEQNVREKKELMHVSTALTIASQSVGDAVLQSMALVTEQSSWSSNSVPQPMAEYRR